MKKILYFSPKILKATREKGAGHRGVYKYKKSPKPTTEKHYTILGLLLDDKLSKANACIELKISPRAIDVLNSLMFRTFKERYKKGQIKLK